VAAIDLNMGCPKPFSVHAGMGAALLSNQLKVKEILTAMVDASPVPVSAKIRVLDSVGFWVPETPKNLISNPLKTFHDNYMRLI
jgi:hypothetical protein